MGAASSGPYTVQISVYQNRNRLLGRHLLPRGVNIQLSWIFLHNIYFLHRNDILHYNLSIENILFYRNDVNIYISICDLWFVLKVDFPRKSKYHYESVEIVQQNIISWPQVDYYLFSHYGEMPVWQQICIQQQNWCFGIQTIIQKIVEIQGVILNIFYTNVDNLKYTYA